MYILLTNDDGIYAPGLAAAHKELLGLGEVAVVAPEDVQSATGHGITLKAPLLTSEVKVSDQMSGIAVDGRPADCVKLAVTALLPRTPDLVVSGINSGSNAGMNVIYSGTVAAAIEAAFLGLPAIALSLYLRNEVTPDYVGAAKLSRTVIDRILAAGLPAGQAVTVNLPCLKPGEEAAGIRVCRQCVRPWADTYEKRLDPRGRAYFWNTSVFSLAGTDADTDRALLRDRYVTVTPLMFDLTDRGQLEKWKGKEWGL